MKKLFLIVLICAGSISEPATAASPANDAAQLEQALRMSDCVLIARIMKSNTTIPQLDAMRRSIEYDSPCGFDAAIDAYGGIPDQLRVTNEERSIHAAMWAEEGLDFRTMKSSLDDVRSKIHRPLNSTGQWFIIFLRQLHVSPIALFQFAADQCSRIYDAPSAMLSVIREAHAPSHLSDRGVWQYSHRTLKSLLVARCRPAVVKLVTNYMNSQH